MVENKHGGSEMMRNGILALAVVAVLLAAILLSLVSASTIYTINDEGNDGYVRGCNCGLPRGEGTYEEAHDNASAYTQSPLDLYVGQMYADEEYFVWRSYLSFNTSNIPNAGITAVTLRLYGEPLGGDLSDMDFTIHVREWISNNSKPVNDDYHAYAPEDVGTFNTALYNSDGDNDILLNSSAVTIGGITRLCLLSSGDLSAVAPTGNEYVLFTTTVKPVLIITVTEQLGFTGPQFLAVALFGSAIVALVIVALVHRRSRYKKTQTKPTDSFTKNFSRTWLSP
jgi:hypothetical protein